MFKRDTTRIVAERLQEKRGFIQVLMGPGQVGKTTAIQQVLAEIDRPYHYAAADLPAPPPTDWIGQQWNLARMKRENRKGAILVLDEIQKISNWSVEVKRLWDEDTRSGSDLQVVLLGSSSLLIQKGLNESLAGRFELIRISHWSFKECRDCFGWSLDKFIYWRQGNYEVDFIVAKARNLTAIEVKSGKRLMTFSGIEKFRESYKNTNVLTIGAQGVEIEKFLETPFEHWIG
jgi:predicted AAA+ superfamily ATPase